MLPFYDAINDRRELFSKKYTVELVALHKKMHIATLHASLFPNIVLKKKLGFFYYSLSLLVTISNSHTLEIGIRRTRTIPRRFSIRYWKNGATRITSANPSLRTESFLLHAHIVCLFVPVYRKTLPRAN